MNVKLIVLLLGAASGSQAFLNVRSEPTKLSSCDEVSCGYPVYLTPYILAEQNGDGQLAAHSYIVPGVECYSGFFTVNTTYNSNMFVWYFPAEESPDTAPVIVFLEGGPGATGMYAIFEENGPIYVTKAGGIGRRDRQLSWTTKFHVLYLDNPVGTGFSFTDDENGYAKDEVDVATNVYEAVLQFFKLFPTLVTHDLYLAGESYGGKYVPAFGYWIHTHNPTAQVKLNLKGLIIGSGFTDPPNQIMYSDYYYQTGVIDFIYREKFIEQENLIHSQIKEGKFAEAFKTFHYYVLSLNRDTLLYNTSKYSDHYNILNYNGRSPYGDLVTFIQQNWVRKAIHVGSLAFQNPKIVQDKLSADVLQSIVPWYAELLNNYRVLNYGAQLDMIVPFVSIENFMRRLDWCGASQYNTTVRTPWNVDGELAGYFRNITGSKCKGSLLEVFVREAGHLALTDQPRWTSQMVSRFIENKPLDVYN